MLEEILTNLMPFLFLSSADRAELAREAETLTFSRGEWIIRQGTRGDGRLFIVLEGNVEVLDETDPSLPVSIETGRYFGERAALFQTPRSHSVRAMEDVRVAAIPGEVFLELLEKRPALAHSLGNILRERQGLFRAFDAFMAELLVGVSEDIINFRALMRHYVELRPALHPHVQDPDVIDFEALTYASNRLPEGITRAFMLYLTDNLDDRLEGSVARLPTRETRARRRAIYEMAPGKFMVMLRDGVSDLIDFVTCLCAFATETRKIRYRWLAPHRLDALAAYVDGQREDVDARAFLLEHGFNADEIDHFERLWPGRVVETFYEIALHHEDYNIQVTKQLQGYNAQHAEHWTGQIAQAVTSLLGHPCADLPPDLPVHIVSSNTHSVHNCLSPFLRHHREEIEAWGAKHHPELCAVDWVDGEDLLYALTRHWLSAHPERQNEREEEDCQGGMIRLASTALTGISVELIDLSKIERDGIDEGILGPDQELCQEGLLVNIDYAFGQQAEEILAILLQLFGANVRSVNILGKAGALVGERGDILVADAFVEQTQDLLEPLTRINGCDLDRLASRVPDRKVFLGPVLTVAGTLLQNNVLLRFYRHIWGCVGLEMEGTYYLRELLKATHLGIIPPDVDMRFVYYVSDVPLSPGETLAGALRPGEGIPPLYAITREVLAGVLAKK